MNYRPEIDGLRAVAVIPVVFFHAGLQLMGGGFIGVDIFFVISGYLIATIILSEKERGVFSIVNFYERRARRILPALFLMMFASLPFAWFLLLPSDLKDFSDSLIAVSTYVSNILFWKESGYWGTANELKPLLHTWSLAVEEQFYIFFPPVLMLLWRFRRFWVLCCFLAVFILSLIASNWGAHHNPSLSFFLLPTRAWELTLGAMIAFAFIYNKESMRVLLGNTLLNELLSFAGLVLIAFSIVMFDASIPHPGLYTLIPTVGAALVIVFASGRTLTGRFLASRPLVGIGLISYSAYLLHQPIIAFTRHYDSAPAGDGYLLCLLAVLTFPLSYLSWRYVEKPYRDKTVLRRKQVFVHALLATLFFISVGVAGHLTNGFDFRATQTDATLAEIDRKRAFNYGLDPSCDSAFTLSPECRTSEEPEILVWGDSHAMYLVKGIMASNPEAKLIQMTLSACGPVFDLAPITPPFYTKYWGEKCLKTNAKVHDWLRQNHSVRYAVLSSRFVDYLGAEGALLHSDGTMEPKSVEALRAALEKTLDALVSLGITPILVSSPPVNGNDIGRCLARAEWKGANPDRCDFDVEHISKKQQTVYAMFESLGSRFKTIRLDKVLCDDAVCRTHLDDTFVYNDENHLSVEGAARLGKTQHFYETITGCP